MSNGPPISFRPGQTPPNQQQQFVSNLHPFMPGQYQQTAFPGNNGMPNTGYLAPFQNSNSSGEVRSKTFMRSFANSSQNMANMHIGHLRAVYFPVTK